MESNAQQQQYVTELQPHDVLFGRGSGPNDHEGNVRFRQYVADRKAAYMATNHRATKTNIAREIVNLVQQQNGRFLKKIEGSGEEAAPECYEVVDDDTIMEKAKQALRQNAAKVREEQEAAGANTKQTQHGYSQSLPAVLQSQQPNTAIFGDLDPIPYPRRPYEQPQQQQQPVPVQSYHHAVSQQQQQQRQFQHPSLADPVPIIWEGNSNAATVASDSAVDLMQQQQQQPSMVSSSISSGMSQINPFDESMFSNSAPYLMPQGSGGGGHRHVVSEPAMGQHVMGTNYDSVAGLGLPQPVSDEIFNTEGSRQNSQEILFGEIQRPSISIQDVFQSSNNSTPQMEKSVSMEDPAPQMEKSTSMEDLLGSFSQLKTSGVGVESEQRRMMASTDTMGTIEGINPNSVADMSLGSSTFSLFGKGNESLTGVFHDVGHFSSGSESNKSNNKPVLPGVPTSASAANNNNSKLPSRINPDPNLAGSTLTTATAGSSRLSTTSSSGSSSKMALDSMGSSTSLLFGGGDSGLWKSAGSINGAIDAVRRQVEAEYPSVGNLPRCDEQVDDNSDSNNVERNSSMGVSSVSSMPPSAVAEQTSSAVLQEHHDQSSSSSIRTNIIKEATTYELSVLVAALISIYPKT